MTHPKKVTKSEKPLFENSNNETEKLLTKTEIAKFLSVSIKMIDRKVMLNEIPFFKIGRLVRFDKKKVVDWMNTGLSGR